MVSLAPKATSTHGRALLLELRDSKNVREDVVLDYIRKDPLSGRLKVPETGDNAFHLLMGRHYEKSFMITVLTELLKVCPEGARAVNLEGSTPLHLCFTQYQLHLDIINMLLQAYPGAAKVADNQSLIPLFLCTMREDSTADICRALCKANPDGPNTKNKTGSFPLHFAAKRHKPNLEILQILLRRNPAAAGCMNSFGLLPMHCISALSDNVRAVAMIHEADPESVKVLDRQGRTCLHLAVLNIGKDHSQAVAVEEEELRMQAAFDNAKRQNDEMEGVEPDYFYGDEDTKQADHLELNERAGKSRAIIRYLISVYPQALSKENNFQATPVDTVLEKTKPVRNKNKILSVYGLYNDPPTARILLLGQRNRSRAFQTAHMSGSITPSAHQIEGLSVVLPNLRPRYSTALRDFNWMARKFALGVSMVGELRYCQIEKSAVKASARYKEPTYYKLKFDSSVPSHSGVVVREAKHVLKKMAKGGKTGSKSVAVSAAASTKKVVDSVFVTAQMSALQLSDPPEISAVEGDAPGEEMQQGGGGDGNTAKLYVIPANNLLARLRREGFDELVRLSIAYI